MGGVAVREGAAVTITYRRGRGWSRNLDPQTPRLAEHLMHPPEVQQLRRLRRGAPRADFDLYATFSYKRSLWTIILYRFDRKRRRIVRSSTRLTLRGAVTDALRKAAA